jgi:hypothetical protein
MVMDRVFITFQKAFRAWAIDQSRIPCVFLIGKRQRGLCVWQQCEEPKQQE